MEKRGHKAGAEALAAGGSRMRAWPRIAVGGSSAALFARLAATLDEERDRGRLSLWLPVCAICGVLLFFAADNDPSPAIASAACAIAALAAFGARSRPVAFPVALALFALTAGFLSAALRVERAAAPVLAQPIRGAAIGVIESVEPRPRGNRVLLRLESLGELSPAQLPRKVRATVRDLAQASAGSRVSIEALWRPPPGPARPGGYDFAREAFFLEIGAVGSEAAAPIILEAAKLSRGQRLPAGVDRLRNFITARILSVVPGDPGAIAAALVTGQRGEISSKANDALRTAGLYHVISISGLHMALFGGALFGVLRFALTLIPGFGLRHPIKKWSAAAALLGAGGYLALSGGEVAAQRSFVMIAIIFIAIIFDRQGITMRNLALAAFCAIVLMPEAVLGPSFQMSFGAVMAIVAWYEARSAFEPDEEREAKRGGLVRFVVLYFGGIVATTIAATLATSPFGAFHFQRFAVHSLPSNLIALPIVGILVMPWVLAGLVLAPFGLDGFAWRIMGFGIELMLAVSVWIASWPGATVVVPAFPTAAIVLAAFGLCWAAIWTTRLRWLAAIPVLAGVAVAAFPTRPDVYVEPGGRAAAVRGPDGRLSLIGTRFASFAGETWLAADGDERGVRDKSVGAAVRCDPLGCTAPLSDGRSLALTWTYAGLDDDCDRAAIIITRLLAPPACRETAHVIDAADLAGHGALALTIGPDGQISSEAARGNGSRAWHGRPALPHAPDFAALRREEAAPEPVFDPTDPTDEEAPADSGGRDDVP